MFILLAINITPLVVDLIEPKPYTQVERKYVEWRDDDVIIQYSFKKEPNCELKRFSIIGVDELPKYLEYTDMDGLGYNYDREPGLHGLDILVRHEQFSVIEIRTTHICGPNFIVVDKVFTRVARDVDSNIPKFIPLP